MDEYNLRRIFLDLFVCVFMFEEDWCRYICRFMIVFWVFIGFIVFCIFVGWWWFNWVLNILLVWFKFKVE